MFLLGGIPHPLGFVPVGEPYSLPSQPNIVYVPVMAAMPYPPRDGAKRLVRWDESFKSVNITKTT